MTETISFIDVKPFVDQPIVLDIFIEDDDDTIVNDLVALK